MPWKPAQKGEVPTLGWYALDWMTDNLAQPDRTSYYPFVPTNEQARFILNLYQLDPVTGKRKYRRAVLSRAKGWGKSPLLSSIAILEALGDIVPDGWDENGQPVGRPWASIRTPWVQVCATSADQTNNAWMPLLEMLRDGPVLDNYPGIDPMETFVALPKGRIEPVTAAATSREGNRPICCIADQTESWYPSNGGVRLSATLRRNLGKTGGLFVESPNAFIPGMQSVAESSAEYWTLIQKGEAVDEGLLYDHREAKNVPNLGDRKALMKGLAEAYGDSAIDAGGWVDLNRIAAEVNDPDTHTQDARAFYLGQITNAPSSWISKPEWVACGPQEDEPIRFLADKDRIVLGFDGSVRDDSTALVACRLEDGFIQLIDCWEKPRDGGDDWQVDREAVDAAVLQTVARYRVVGMYCDPALWQDYVDRWTREFGRKLRLKAVAGRPLEWWTNRSTAMVAALERFHSAVMNQELIHDGDSVLMRHVLAAHRKVVPAGVLIRKDTPHSSRKIDACMAAVLAYEARSDAVAQGINRKRVGRVAQRVL